MRFDAAVGACRGASSTRQRCGSTPARRKENRTIEALRLDGAWTEGGVTWSNQPATAGPAATSASGIGVRLARVERRRSGAGDAAGSNNGFLIRDANESQDAEQQYNSREKGTDRPQLVITFRIGP